MSNSELRIKALELAISYAVSFGHSFTDSITGDAEIFYSFLVETPDFSLSQGPGNASSISPASSNDQIKTLVSDEAFAQIDSLAKSLTGLAAMLDEIHASIAKLKS